MTGPFRRPDAADPASDGAPGSGRAGPSAGRRLTRQRSAEEGPRCCTEAGASATAREAASAERRPVVELELLERGARAQRRQSDRDLDLLAGLQAADDLGSRAALEADHDRLRGDLAVAHQVHARVAAGSR